jgi:hypothetical protein
MNRRRDEDDDDFDEHGILKDYRSFRVPMRAVDSWQRDMARHLHRTSVTDVAGNDGLALCRPGWRVDNSGNAGDRLLRDGEKQTLYDEYDLEIEVAWKHPSRGFDSDELVGQREGDMCELVCIRDDQTNSRKDPYREYDTHVQVAWRNP